MIGHRPIDLHLLALKEMGAEGILKSGVVEIDGSGLKPRTYLLVVGMGLTLLVPQMQLWLRFLPQELPSWTVLSVNRKLSILAKCPKMGAKISGAGSHLIKIDYV